MSSNAKSTARKSARASKKLNDDDSVSPLIDTRLRKDDWLILPLGVLVGVCIYTIVASNRALGYLLSSPQSTLTEPVFVASLVAIFGLVYIYKTLKRRPIYIFPKVVAYILSSGILLFGVMLVMRAGQPCTGFFGVASDCSSVYYFQLWLLLFNPFIAPLLALATAISTVALFRKT